MGAVALVARLERGGEEEEVVVLLERFFEAFWGPAREAWYTLTTGYTFSTPSMAASWVWIVGSELLPLIVIERP